MPRRKRGRRRKAVLHKGKPRPSQKRYLPILIIGVLLFFVGNILGNRVPEQGARDGNKAIAPVATLQAQSLPIRIKIAKIGLDVAIVPGGIQNGNWMLTETSAQYLPTSGRPGEGFNTIIYAHRLPNLFGRLSEVQIGDIITIEDSTQKSWYYRVYSRESIDPSDIGRLYSPMPNIVTLFTCDGWFDAARLLVRARINLPQESPVWIRGLIE